MRTLESYRKQGFKPPDEIDYQERNFFSKVSTKYPIQRVVTKVVRLKARDYSIGNHVATKEYLVYYENWYGKNWLGTSFLRTLLIMLNYTLYNIVKSLLLIYTKTD